MSSEYNRPFNGVVPELVEDVNLKRARVETSDGGSAIRVTATATDLAPITDALGTQQDSAQIPTVIGLLKNLIASGGGGGGGGASTTLMVPRIQVYDTLVIGGGYDQGRSWFAPLQITFDLNGEPITSFPDWADYIGFYSVQDGNLGVCKLKNNGSNKIIILEIRSQSNPDETMAGGPSMQLIKDYAKIELDEIFDAPSVPLSMTCYGWQEDWSSGSPTVRNYSDRDYSSFIPFVFSLSSFEISGGGGGGGGGGEAISTYSLSLNNTTVTDITAPTEDPPSSNDQTLATVSHVDDALTAYTKSAPIINSHVTITPQSPTLTLDTPPTWCRYLQITVRLAGAHQTTNVSYNPAPSVPHTNFGITRQYWISSDNKLRTVWCEFDYENATNTITWTNYVVWDINFTTGTATKLYAGLNQYEGGYPLNIVSVIALA